MKYPLFKIYLLTNLCNEVYQSSHIVWKALLVDSLWFIFKNLLFLPKSEALVYLFAAFYIFAFSFPHKILWYFLFPGSIWASSSTDILFSFIFLSFFAFGLQGLVGGRTTFLFLFTFPFLRDFPQDFFPSLCHWIAFI